MTILKFSPETIFVNIISNLVNAYKEKYGKRAKVRVKHSDDLKK